MVTPEQEKYYVNGLVALRLNLPEKALEWFRKISDKYALYTDALFEPSDFILPHIARFHDVQVYTHRWSIFRNHKIYDQQMTQRNFEIYPCINRRVSKDENFAIVEELPTKMQIAQPCIFLGGDDNYCHWINRYLLRLSLLEGYPEFAQLPLLVTEELQSYHKESLQILGISEDRLIKVPRDIMIECKDLIVPVVVRGTPLLTQGVKWFRKKLDRYLGSPDGSHIYISRKGSVKRIMTNEKDVLKLLAKYNFTVVVPHELSFEEQVKVFSRASIIVGPHGAGLVNAIFAPEGAHLIELSNKIISFVTDFEDVALSIPLEYTKLISKVVKVYPDKIGHDFHDYVVDVQKLDKVLEAATQH